MRTNRNTHKTRSTRAPRWAQHQFNQEPTFEQVVEAADYAASLVGPLKALELPLLLGDDLSNAILAYREQAEGRKVHITPELRAKVDLLTEYLVEHSRQVDDEEVQTAQETNPLAEILLGLGVPEEIVEQAMNLSVTVAEYLTELVGDEDLALEVYDQLDPMFAPFAILAYRDQANGGETYLEPEVRKELDRLTEILAEISREQEAEDDEDDQLEFPDYDLPPEVKDRINCLTERLAGAMSGMGVADVEEQDSFDHYEDYRVNSDHWPTEYDEYFADSESYHQLLQENILRAARKNGGYVLATREVWAKPVAKSVDGRWVFETEYGLEYLDFEDYEFSPEFIDFEHEESLVDMD